MDSYDPSTSSRFDVYRAESVHLLMKRAPAPGVYKTVIAALHIIRSDVPTEPIHSVHRPTLCLIVQGWKELALCDERYLYDPLHYLVVSLSRFRFLAVCSRRVFSAPIYVSAWTLIWPN